MSNPTIVSQTQDKKEDCKRETGILSTASTSDDSKTKAYVLADCKPMVKLTLDGQRMMIAHNHGKKRGNIQKSCHPKLEFE